MANAADPNLGIGRPTRVKNKTPASIQISAEQILREARERHQAEFRPPKHKITDSTELGDYRLRKRKEFEDLIRCNKNVWVKYAKWEESQKDFTRSRSVWERALDVDSRGHTLWLKYADFELWHKYIHTEEVLGNVAAARQIFERWMDWMPDQQGWLSYIEFELMYNEVERARDIFERFVESGDDEEAEDLFVAFAEFEEKCKEIERDRCFYKFALDHIPKGRAEELYKKFVAFEKQYGDREGIDDAIFGERRLQCEDEVRKNPLDYDVWFDYIRSEERCGDRRRIEDVYERAIANLPPAQEKRYWELYIYLWIKYVLYEELDAQDVDRTRDIYNSCLKMIPREKFSFAKIWLMSAQFEIRHLNTDRARKILGSAIGMAAKDKIFKKYTEIVLQLGNIERCRKLYEKYLEWSPENCYAWSKYANLERSSSETDQLLWKAYIDFEISECEYERTRTLYEKLLDRTKHLNVWISYAKFEASVMQEVLQDLSENEYKKKCLQHARDVFERGLSYFRTSAPELKEERAMLLEEWLTTEKSFGELGNVELVTAKLPKKLKKRRHIETEDGPAGYEEYIDYLFPEEIQTRNLKILEAAYKWKKQKIASDDDYLGSTDVAI
ncbi:hypothetical protein SASPL_143273 [Salvia splendens]|uniref:Crooked neck n=1 Tax=Salvia splendens TaxID=180675 RepID=A0A8X8ZAP1_SALSN|nr:hypothetical protein SASPL_143273 [Salvia splendens]